MDKQKVLDHMNNDVSKNTLMQTLGIVFTAIGDDFLQAQMPVTSKVHQPAGLLHGGASVALAESVGSFASHLFIDINKYEIRGLEISANHLKSVKEGIVTATARPVHKGKTTHLWEIKITDEDNNLISLCKLTNILLPKR